MPIFEYRCKKCGKDFEELVLKADETPACPHCGSVKTDKLMSRCRAKSGGGSDFDGGDAGGAPSGGGGCSGCSGGNCSSCH